MGYSPVSRKVVAVDLSGYMQLRPNTVLSTPLYKDCEALVLHKPASVGLQKCHRYAVLWVVNPPTSFIVHRSIVLNPCPTKFANSPLSSPGAFSLI